MGKAIIAAKVSDFWEFIDPIYLYIGGACLLLLVVVAILMIASAAISCASREKTMIFSGVNGQIIRDIIQSVTQP